MNHGRRPLVLYVTPMLLASASGLAAAQTFGPEEVAVNSARSNAALLLLDFDRDGDRDVVQTAIVGDLFGVWFENLGTSQFTAQRALGTGSAAAGVDAVAVDLDGDGDDDIAFCGLGVGWVENLGPSTFGAPQMLGTSTASSRQIEVGDINGDGLIDLVTYEVGGTVGWLANLGSGSFSSTQVLGQNLGDIRGIDVADLDLDGDLDVVYAVRTSSTSGEIRWLEQNGAGAFAGASTLVDVGDRLFDPVVADIDADGIPDLVFRSDRSFGFLNDRILSRRGLAGGGFGPDERLYGIDSGTIGGFSLIDLRGIGRPDLLVSSSTQGVVLLRNLMGTSFGSPRMLSDAPPNSIADFEADDLDGDGRVDLVVAARTSVRMFRGGAPNFDPPVELSADIDIARFRIDQSLASDLSGDGIADVVISSDLSFDPVSRVHLGLGNGAIVSPGQPLEVLDRLQLEAIDFDGDGDLDLVSSDGEFGFGSTSAYWQENLGGGLFADADGLFVALALGPAFFATGDREGDGDLDLLVRYTSLVSLQEFAMEWVDQVAPGVFAPGPAVVPSDTPGDVQLADVDGDGVADAIVVRDIIGTESLVWRRGDGTGQFGPDVIVRDASELPLEDAAVGDMNGDGRLDLVVYGEAGIELYLWDATSSSFSGPTLVEGPAPVSSITRLSLADLNGNGLPDVLASGLNRTARWIANMGGGTFGSPQLLPEDLPGSLIVGAADRDGDLDVDILKLQPTENLAWNVNSSRFGFGECGPAAQNSTGEAGAISAMGSPAVANNDVTLLVERLPASVFGYFLVAPTEGFLPGVGGSQGNLCLSGPLGRFTRGPGDIFQTTGAGAAELRLDLLNIPTPTGTEALAPGDTRYFQAWFRDVNPGSTSNLTNALRIPFE